MKHDIIIIGAGPAGLSFARSLANTSLQVLVIERMPLSALQNPKADGREIALTHFSVKVLKELNAWSRIPKEAIAPLKEAKVLNGDDPYTMDFYSSEKSITELGYLVPNYLIRKALYEEVASLNNVEILTEKTVSNLQSNDSCATLSLENGESYEASLIVAADSRFSDARKKMGIPCHMNDFSRVTIVCRMEHEKSHQQTAVECFHYGRTHAILPMQGNMSSIVITIPTNLAESIINMDEESFNADIQQRLNNRLGKMKLIGEKFSYPLIAVHADKFIAKRFALIGDASVGMHPVTAHGFNLGLRGQDTLYRAIKSALDKNKDFASNTVLEKYQNKHMLITKPLYFGTNGIVALFTNDTIPARALRKATLRVANNLAPIKGLITRKLTEKGVSPIESLKERFPFFK